jgi:hypothetical protein
MKSYVELIAPHSVKVNSFIQSWQTTSAGAVSQFEKNVIPRKRQRDLRPDERREAYRDPESGKTASYNELVDPGPRPVSRDLAGMTNCDTASLYAVRDKWPFLPHFQSPKLFRKSRA